MLADPAPPGNVPDPEPSERPAGLEIRGAAPGLLDDPILLEVRGAGPREELVWRARYRDDDQRVWRASAADAVDLSTAWAPAKAGTGSLAALSSLRPVGVDVRVQASDGRAAGRTLTRRLVADGVRLRRWRDGPAAILHLPAVATPVATVVVDATAGERHAVVATVAGPLLASRGVLVLVVGPCRRATAGRDAVGAARKRLAAVPAASTDVQTLRVLDPVDSVEAKGEPGTVVVLPPNVGAREVDNGAAADRAVAWDALLARLGARARQR